MKIAGSGCRIAVAALAITAAAAGCVGTGPEPGGGPDVSRGYFITSERIAATGASTVWDALRLTVRFATFTEDRDGRPSSIKARGRSSIKSEERMLVFVDHVPLADIRLLDDMPVTRVERIQVLRGLDATTFFGTNAGDGVIHIFTRNR